MKSGYHFPIESSNVFRFYELENKEIQKIKWLESEKEGKDIGEFRANWIWWAYYRNNWRSGMHESGFF